MTSPRVAKLDPAKVRAIYAMRARGVPCKQVAARFDISRSVVSRIGRGEFYPEATADLRARVAAPIDAALAEVPGA